MKKVLITEKIHPDAEALLRQHFEVVQGSGTANVAAELAGCEGVLVRSAHVTAEDMAQNPQLKVIAKHGMGLDAIDMEEAEARGIAVVNAPYSNLNAVAEHIVMLILALSKRTVRMDTGTQTVRDLPVVTNWETETLRQELEQRPRMLFILTNSRSLSSEKTQLLHTELAENLVQASRQAGRAFLLVSRGDSTLRGYFPLETETLRNVLEKETGARFNGEILCPFFRKGDAIPPRTYII